MINEHNAGATFEVRIRTADLHFLTQGFVA